MRILSISNLVLQLAHTTVPIITVMRKQNTFLFKNVSFYISQIRTMFYVQSGILAKFFVALI